MADVRHEDERLKMIGLHDQDAHGLVHVIDDDVTLTDGLSDRLKAFGFEVQNHRSPAAFVQARREAEACCLLLSIEFPAANGLDFQEILPAVGIHLPVILMTKHADINWSVRGMKAGAVDFLLKPLREDDVLSSIRVALQKDRERHSEERRRRKAEDLLAKLTAREHQVMGHVVRGLMNKQIAGVLGLSEITVKLHRGSMMRKMGVRNVPDLVRAAEFANASSRAH
jgi:FixJ family two-component response regulator